MCPHLCGASLFVKSDLLSQYLMTPVADFLYNKSRNISTPNVEKQKIKD